MIEPIEQSFSSLLEERRSAPRMSPAPLREIVNTLAFATRPHFVLEGDELQRSRRPTPSAGALHPVETVLINPRRDTRVFRYEPRGHTLDMLVVQDTKPLLKFRALTREVLPDSNGWMIIFIGDSGRVEAAYEHPCTLLWRDAGALLQTLALVAESFRLAFCPLGVVGHEVVKALALQGAVPLGVAAMGRPIHSG